MKSLLTAVAAAALLAACNQSDNANQALADASASANEAAASVENAVAVAPATPLEKEAALAMMKTRHDNYEKIGDAMKVLSRELKGDSPNLTAVRSNADTIATLAPQVKDWFPAGTGKDVGKTHALPAIWEKPEDFAAKARGFERAAAAFQAATKGTDIAAMQASLGDLGKSCKACHDLYREKDD